MQRSTPLLIYDGDCGFCIYCVNYAKAATGVAVDYAPYQQVAEEFPDISEEQFRASIQLVQPDGSVVTGAEAAFRTLEIGGYNGFWAWCYRTLPLFAWLAERDYNFVAAHRNVIYRVSKWLFGTRLLPQELSVTIALFLRLLALVYLAAFVSFAVQAQGLIGSDGILPLAPFLDAIEQKYGWQGYRLLPTLFWLNASDLAIQFVAWAGAVVSVALLFNLASTLCLIVLYLLYLSLFGAGQIFMGYQWDILLLECGFLAIFLRAWPNLFTWLFRWLLFRFMLQSGLVKLLSGDQSWWDLTALSYHFESQPLPTALAWYAHKLPGAVLQGGVVFTFVMELMVPFLLLMPRMPRLVAAIAILLFELIIFCTGSYNFFNLLTVVLCVLLLDDQFLQAITPTAIRQRISRLRPPARPVLVVPLILVATVYILLSTMLLTATGNRAGMSETSRQILSFSSPLHIANSYGLFAVMTRTRPEIILEGSMDGSTWQAYELPYKPGALDRAPVWATPHQPRLDWQLWFAALAPANRNPWLQGLMVGILRGSPSVSALFETNPFPDEPPRYIRAQLYQYRFSSRAHREATGQWWTRELQGTFFPAARLN